MKLHLYISGYILAALLCFASRAGASDFLSTPACVEGDSVSTRGDIPAEVRPCGTAEARPAEGGIPAGRSAAGRERFLRLERFEISGNRRLGTGRIAASLGIAPGDTIDASILERERQRLLASNGIIRAAFFSTAPGTGRGFVVLRIEIEERDAVNFETGYGYHDRYGWFLTLLGVRVERPFDKDSDFRIGLRLGFHVLGVEAEWKKHAGAGGGFGYGARLYSFKEDHIFFGYQDPSPPPEGAPPFTWDGSEWRSFSQEISRGGFEASIDYKAAGFGFSFGAGVETVRPDSSFEDVESDLEGDLSDFPEAMRPDIEETVLTGIFLRMVRDTRDSFIYPVRGSYTYFRTQASNTILGGDRVFSMTRFDHVRFVDLGGDRTLALRIAAGSVSRGAPYYEKFSLGGIYSIRGYRELSLSQAEGSDGFWIFGGELRAPLIDSPGEPPRLSGLLFFDAGQGWPVDDSISGVGIYTAAGYGVRLRLPWLGTLGVDAGVALSDSRNGDDYRIHGSLGFSF